MFTAIYNKIDLRNKKGFVKCQIDIEASCIEDAEIIAKKQLKSLFLKNKIKDLNIVLTFVERTNIITGKKYFERFDTPSYCSPSSEHYWSF